MPLDPTTESSALTTPAEVAHRGPIQADPLLARGARAADDGTERYCRVYLRDQDLERQRARD